MTRVDNVDEASDTNESETPSTSFGLPRPSATLAALTTSALALPGMVGPARADAPIERASASSSFSYYFEDDLPDRKFESGTGDQERYEVFTKQLRFDIPTSERTDIGIDFLYEEMSGASPWYVTFDSTSGSTLQVMSGATIEDERFDASIDIDYYLDEGKDTFSTGVSKENDYLSLHWGLAAERSYNDKNTTASLSGSFAYDWVEPTDGGTLGRIVKDNKWSVDLFAGISQIVSRSSTVQFTVNYKHAEGFLNDPYKLISIIGPGGTNLPDVRPDSRELVSMMARYRHHFEDVEASIHADYRLFFDDWGTVSHTLEVAWYQRVFDWLTITPGLRWYSQSKADFYEPFLDPTATIPDEHSSDFRLSPFGAVSAKIKADVEIIDLFEYNPSSFAESLGITEGVDLIATFSYERYMSDGHFGIQSLGEFEQAPGLVNFNVIAFSLSGRF